MSYHFAPFPGDRTVRVPNAYLRSIATARRFLASNPLTGYVLRKGSIRRILERAHAFKRPALDDGIELSRFRCNICGQQQRSSMETIRAREARSCRACGSTLRFRTIVNGLSIGLFGAPIALPDFPARPDLRGIGLSDAGLYASPLSKKMSYTNTFFHTEPRLDITNIEHTRFHDLDFLIASDVFEHVPPPVDIAFRNARRLLKIGGAFVFSVPFVPGTTVEHFPDLYRYELELRQGRHVLLNVTRDGCKQEFHDLVFHGGPGSTLEMRVFGLQDITRHFLDAGFSQPTLLSDAGPEFGIDFDQQTRSIPMLALAR